MSGSALLAGAFRQLQSGSKELAELIVANGIKADGAEEKPLVDDFVAVENRLTEAHPTLSPQLRKAAAYVLDNPGEIATQSMRAVAAKSGVPFANFSRLAQTIGFSTYNDLREVYRRHVQSGVGTGYPEKAERLQASGRISGDDAIWTSFRDSAFSNVSELYNRVDSQAISAITSELLKRDRIFIAGMQASYPIASYLDYVGGMVRPNLVILGRQGGVTADDMTDLSDRDAIICLAIRPCARLTVQLAELASKRGTYVLGITDSRASPLFAKSTDTLLVPCHSPSFFESYLGTVAVLELLVGFMTVRGGKEAVRRIEQIESDREELGEYWPLTKK